MKSSIYLFLLIITVFQLVGTVLRFTLFGIRLWGPEEEKPPFFRIFHEDQVYVDDGGGNENFRNDFQQANEQFALRLMKRLESETNNNQNVLISPFSIGVAMSMAMIGADGDTYQQIHSTFGFSKSITRDHITSGYQQLLPKLYHNNVSIGNALAVTENLRLLSDYRSKILTNFSSDIFAIDPFYDPQKACNRINEWCHGKTQGMIPELLSSPFDIPSDTSAVLLNAIFFQSNWVFKFSKSLKSMEFHTNKAQSKLVKCMDNMAVYNYAQFDDGQLVELPYKDTNVSMFVYLPRNHHSSPLSSLFENETLSTRISKMNRTRGFGIEVKIPPFKFESSYSQLESTLQKLGIMDAFTTRANFSLITRESNMKLSRVLHKAVIEVDQTGTKAAAATGVFIAHSPHRPPRVILNRPFAFFIREQISRTILFSGVIRDPSGLQQHV